MSKVLAAFNVAVGAAVGIISQSLPKAGQLETERRTYQPWIQGKTAR